MDKLRIQIITLISIIFSLLITLSFVNALNPEIHPWFIIIGAINIFCSIYLFIIMIMVSISCVKMINLVENLNERCRINMKTIFSCFVFIFVFSHIAYVLFIHGSKSEYLIITVLLIIAEYICRIIIVGSICIMIAVSINGCYTCYKCADQMIDDKRKRNRAEEDDRNPV